MKSRRRPPWGWALVGLVLLSLLLMGAAWAGYWFLGAVWVPGWAGWVRGVVSVWAALLTLGLVSWAWGRFVGHRRPRFDFFGALNDALRRISQGDYTVQLPVDQVDGGGPDSPLVSLAENLNAMAGALARVEELRQQFVADVSHEFQSPLTSILGFAQALRGDLPEELRLRYLGIIEAEARRLSRLSENLLRLNSLEDRAGPPDAAPFRLDVQIRRVLVNLEPLWSAKGLEIEAELEALEVVGNEELWTQVWTNLVQNAVKFTPPGGKITVRTLPGPVVEVQDTGIGLTNEERARVFERFYKAESARTHGEGGSGSGLGLALVQRIVLLHGGRVEALSPGPGRGTTLRVELPRSLGAF